MSYDTLQDAIDAFSGFVDKTDGDLIMAQEWNNLVGFVKRVGDDLKALTGRVALIEDYVGYTPEYDGDNLKERIEAIENYVGQAYDPAGAATLTGRVATLEEVDNVTQTEFDGLEDAVQPLLEQYIVTFAADDTKYLIGDTATVTATVTTLAGDVPKNRPWIDFIATWGRLKNAPGFSNVREGADYRSLSVRTDSQGIAKVQVTAEQNKGLTSDEEDDIQFFMDTDISGDGETFKKRLKESSNPYGEKAREAYDAASKAYDRGGQTLGKLVDDHYAGKLLGRNWWGKKPQSRYDNFRVTVVGFAKNDADATTPDHCRGVSTIQLLFQDWVSPWIGVYLDDDEAVVATWKDHFGEYGTASPEHVFEKLEDEVAQSVFPLGPIAREKAYRAIAKAVDRVDDDVINDPDDWVKEAIKNAADTQRFMDVIQDSKAAIGIGITDVDGPAMKSIFAQGRQVKVVDNRVAQVKGEVLASPEIADMQGAVLALQDSTVSVGKDLMGALSDIENKVVNINAFDSDALETSVNQIKAHIGIAKNYVPNGG